MKCLVEKMKEYFDEHGKNVVEKSEYFKPIREIMSDIGTNFELRKTYSENLKDFQKELNKQLHAHSPSLIFRDEAEMFKPHTSPLYNYPYQKRQSVVAPHIPLILSDFDEHQDYLYAQYDVHLGFSQVCLEQSLFM